MIKVLTIAVAIEFYIYISCITKRFESKFKLTKYPLFTTEWVESATFRGFSQVSVTSVYRLQPVTTGLCVRRVMPSAASIVDRITSVSIDRRHGTASYAFRRQFSASRHRARPSRRCTVTAIACLKASLHAA